MLACKQEEQLRAGAAEQEKRLQRIEEDAAAAERRANILRSDAETQANRIVRLLPETASTGLVTTRRLPGQEKLCIGQADHPAL